ncbi:N-acetylmuramoyl-L-alanine amidase family protein [Croceivirga thetidis]|uniref:N-acetylmuramoyl-L-alanine amidase n=1 Tax=Croceivirga thetidis TaxID=2721623 RepID=A0ABX1GQ04_9FLAO|nr:N-acetylmuramoyl-L-alanine amidase [Croceivirga thetidis]NKI31993.1 N-acetylmuramoyl-L-alanine amidase [Croceivirga thetidis]
MFKKCSVLFIFLVSFLFFSSFHKNDTESTSIKKFVVVLDAGHGGHDPGNLGNGFLEKDIALAITKKVGALLAKNKDIKVVYTREDDTFIGLQQRGAIANEAKADLFVSIHCNAHKSEAYGTETFVLGLHANDRNFEVAKKENSVIYLEDNYEMKYGEYDINSPESVIGLTIMQEEFLEQSLQIAGLVQSRFKTKLKRKDRGPKQAGFIVLHQTFMPSILIEVGFLTNKSEGAYLNSDKGQNEMSNTIAQSILDYKNGVEAGSIEIKSEPKEDVMAKEKVVEKAPEVKKPESKQVATEKPTVEAVKQQAEPTKELVEEVIEPKKVEPEPSTSVQNTTKEVVENKVDETKIETKKVLPEKVSSKTVSEVAKTSHGVTFKVQIMATVDVIPLDGKFFRGLDTISKEPFQNLFRYMYGETDKYESAKQLKSNADAKGYTDSYIVSYKDGERIPLWKALKLISD